ncbi:MAG: septal ring lytic transglycosylase RlpA family protein [Lewinellaceae bacterium]|jgi:rare lipoprotein A|nr:septal ring lytic transglycosylase RlpA family protein [Lewinellaceae bacterium]
MRRTVILLAGIFAFTTANYAGAHAQSAQEEFGKCGYYADALQGRKTASGEKYDKNLLTCAHKTLPFGTTLKITRLDNGKSVTVRVNDRGPFIEGYVTDVSRKAAEAIGLVRDGVTKVKIEIVGSTTTAKSITGTVSPATYSTSTQPQTLQPAQPATTTRAASVSAAKAQLVKPKAVTAPATGVSPATYSAPSATVPAKAAAKETAAVAVSEVYQVELKQVQGRGYGLQLAVLSTTENLFQNIASLQATWPGKVIVNHEDSSGKEVFKLILGPYATRSEATAQQKKAATKGYKKTFVVEFE